MKQRIQTAIIALIIFVPFVLYGDWPFVIFTYLLATIGILELLRMYNIKALSFVSILSIGFLWLLLNPENTYTLYNTVISKFEIGILYTLIVLAITVLTKNKFTFSDAGFVLMSTIYVFIGFHFLIIARMNGLNYVLYALFIIWATDTGAYFFGRAIGKRKLWPEISPNKTIGGAIGGILIAVVVGVIFQLIQPFDMSMIMIVLVTVLASITGQIGDLAASAYKREYNVKDSGKLLPGHGGILDRMDSLLFVLPLLYLLQFIS